MVGSGGTGVSFSSVVDGNGVSASAKVNRSEVEGTVVPGAVGNCCSCSEVFVMGGIDDAGSGPDATH